MIPNRIAIIGGSTVQGEGDPANGGFVARLKSWHEAKNPSINCVFNLGVSGDTTKDMIRRGSSEAKARRANLIIVYPGLNDLIRKDSPSAPTATPENLIPELLSELISSLQAVAPTIAISAVPPDERRTTPFRERFYFLRSDAQEMSERIAKVVTQLSALYLNIYQRWSARSDLTDLLIDGLHCNASGHQELFEETRLFLSKTFGGNSAG